MIKRLFSQAAAWLDDLIFPPGVRCLSCRRALDEDEADGLCLSCVRALDALAAAQEERERVEHGALPEGIAYVHSAFVYDAQARELVHRLKYQSIRAAAVPLAKGMAILPTGEEEILVPVPTDERRRRMRGFNQATLLAQTLSSAWGMPMCEALVRVRRCAPQTGLNEQQRRENLVGCMAVKARSVNTIRGRRILLIDDVYTTGSTAAEAARALLDAGARSVGVLTAARAGMEKKKEDIAFLTRHKQGHSAEKPWNI